MEIFEGEKKRLVVNFRWKVWMAKKKAGLVAVIDHLVLVLDSGIKNGTLDTLFFCSRCTHVFVYTMGCWGFLTAASLRIMNEWFLSMSRARKGAKMVLQELNESLRGSRKENAPLAANIVYLPLSSLFPETFFQPLTLHTLRLSFCFFPSRCSLWSTHNAGMERKGVRALGFRVIGALQETPKKSNSIWRNRDVWVFSKECTEIENSLVSIFSWHFFFPEPSETPKKCFSFQDVTMSTDISMTLYSACR